MTKFYFDLVNFRDYSHILGDALTVIINEEKHPDPKDCNGVDYAEIYKFILDLLNGDLPKQLNEATSLKIMEMMNVLKDAVINTEQNTIEERELLEKYAIRDVAGLNAPFEGKCTDSQIEVVARMPKINPLAISSTFWTKPILRKESSHK